MEERRTDMLRLMKAMEEQNKILIEQSLSLDQICKFITPVSAFFAALKNFVIFMAWLVGLISAGVAIWQGAWHWLVDFVKTH